MDPASPPPFTSGERADLIRRIRELNSGTEQGGGPRSTPQDRATELAMLELELARRVPRPVVSYDPIDGQPFRLGIDTFGLDGSWWDLDGPDRPDDEPLPLTWYAATGAMRLQEPYEDSPFPVRVGPIAPFVVPRVLRRPGVVAVVSRVPIGRHTGWLIVYFAPWPRHPPGKRVNEWARRSYRARTAGGSFDWESVFEFEPEWDFDLDPWIARGKLLWTPPDEPGTPARSDVDGCPYLGLLRPGDPVGRGILSFGTLSYTEVTEEARGRPNPNDD